MNPTLRSEEKNVSEPLGKSGSSEIFFAGKKILLVANTAWNLWNFRRSLIEHLIVQGTEVVCVAPEDGFQWHLGALDVGRGTEDVGQRTLDRGLGTRSEGRGTRDGEQPTPDPVPNVPCPPSPVLCPQSSVPSPSSPVQRPSSICFLPLRHLSRKSILSLSNILLFLELVRLLRREKPDVALFFTIKPNVLGAFSARWCGVPVVSVIEGRGISATSQHWLRAMSVLLYRLALRSVQRVVFINPDDRADFLRYRIVQPEQAVLMSGPGVDAQHFAPRPKSGRDFTFLFPARLLAEKGIREFAHAATLLKKRGLNARFQILGNTDSGNPTSISKDELEIWVAEGCVEYLGFTDDVRPHIAEADVVVLPSYYREGVPRCLLEAMSMEKPVLTTHSVGCRETVDEGQNGFLIAPRDVKVLADAMQMLANLPPEKLRQMGLHSRQKAVAQFSDEVVLPQFLAVIRAALGSAPKLRSGRDSA